MKGKEIRSGKPLFHEIVWSVVLIGTVWAVASYSTRDAAKATTWTGLYVFVALVGVLVILD